MNKKGMIKKHLVTCSVMFVLVIISGFAISNKPVKAPANLTAYHLPARYVFTKTTNVNDFSFADEALPVNDSRVDKKMRHTLSRYDFNSVQSDVLLEKAKELFPVIEPILKAYGIPDDFKYMPLVETGLCSGISSKGAAGLWQFMPGTARTYGLIVGHGIDERLNIQKSTVAACKYIKELYNEFNSWTLAAAAYNNGEIKLQHQINKQDEDNYFRMHLNRETGDYVYELIAMKQVITNPVNYGYEKQKYYSKPSSQLLAYN